MESTNNILIIGGGASGLMCALTACLKGKSVTILESGFKLGKKILASGNGRCNLTNKNISENCYNVFPDQLNQFNNFSHERISSLSLFSRKRNEHNIFIKLQCFSDKSKVWLYLTLFQLIQLICNNNQFAA